MQKKEAIVVGAVMLLFLGSFFLAFGSAGSAARIDVRANSGIRINNDTDFSTMAASEGWPGSGTQGDPYVIGGYSIDAQGAGSAIYIGNTTVYFVVENCNITNVIYKSIYFYTGYGIILYNTKNGRIDNNTIENADGGVDLQSYSYGITVENNRIENVTTYGINVDGGNNDIIENNTISNSGGKGIVSRNSYTGTFKKNKIIDGGLSISDGNSNIIEDNVISHPQGDGIYLYSTHDNKIYGNILTGGAIFMGDDENTYTMETITTNNTLNGKPIYYYSNVALHNTSIPSGAGEVILGNVTYVKVENLNIDNVSIALQIGYSST